MTARVEHSVTNRPRTLAGAPSTSAESQVNSAMWDIDAAKRHVYRLQLRIAKAVEKGRYNKARALQRLLTSSFSGKLLAVHRVMNNRGRKTPGIDGVIWSGVLDKANAVAAIRRRGYRAQPLRRIYIPKSNGKERALGIPTMTDRAMQALHRLALEPWAEVTADRNSYGFRPKRSTHDALESCFQLLSRKHSPKWVLDADIKGCFDYLSHDWLLANVPMDKGVLNQWLRCGYIDKRVYHQTASGTPQGGIISPMLCNMALDGLESALKSTVPAKSGHCVNVTRYADDIVVTGATKELLEEKIRPAMQAFMAERGLTLSEEKTRIVHIDEGFDFLGCNLRKYDGKLLITPTKEKVLVFAQEVRAIVKRGVALPTHQLLTRLNRTLRGWFNYYRPWCSKRTFSYLDTWIYRAMWWWMRRRHSNRKKRWLYGHYTQPQRTPKGTYRRVFTGQCVTNSGVLRRITLFKLGDLPIVRHVKIMGHVHPYSWFYWRYLRKRWHHGRNRRQADRRYLAKFRLAT